MQFLVAQLRQLEVVCSLTIHRHPPLLLQLVHHHCRVSKQQSSSSGNNFNYFSRCKCKRSSLVEQQRQPLLAPLHYRIIINNNNSSECHQLRRLDPQLHHPQLKDLLLLQAAVVVLMSWRPLLQMSLMLFKICSTLGKDLEQPPTTPSAP